MAYVYFKDTESGVVRRFNDEIARDKTKIKRFSKARKIEKNEDGQLEYTTSRWEKSNATAYNKQKQAE